MFDAIFTIYRGENINWNMLLRIKLRATQMKKIDIAATSLIKINKLYDQCATTWKELKHEDLVHNLEWAFIFMETLCLRCLCLRNISTFDSWEVMAWFYPRKYKLQRVEGIETKEKNSNPHYKYIECQKKNGT